MRDKIMDFVKKILHIIEPEGIPFPGSMIYSLIINKFGLYNSVMKQIAMDEHITNIKGTILDIGTGPAYLPIFIVKNNPHCKVIGLDISPSMLRIALQNIRKASPINHINLKLGNVTNIPYPDQTFDFIISTGSFHHWKKPLTALNEIYRVLKNNGETWIFDVFNPIPRQQFIQLCQKYGRLIVTLFYLHTFSEPFYDSQKINQLFRNSLFKGGEIENFEIFYKIKLKKRIK